MEMLHDYLLYNWVLILIVVAFIVVLFTTAFLDNRSTKRLYFLVGEVFLLSIVVFIEFYYEGDPNYNLLRLILMSIRYSATPLMLAHVIFALVKKAKAIVFIPAGVLLIVDIASIFTGIIFGLDENGKLVRGPGPLGYLPFIVAGLYCAFLIYILIKRSNKRLIEIIPIIFLSLSFLSCVVFPFIFGKEFSQLFCPTIAIALLIYYVFSILQLTKKDALTGLLNRQAYYAEASRSFKDITAIVSMDMNGLKVVNDTYGHAAGDEALVTLAICFTKACKISQSAYRMGGDEFAIVCRKNSEEEVIKLIERINEYVSKTKYTCSIGYSYQKNGHKGLEDLLKLSDERMYSNKAEYYRTHERVTK